MSTDLTHDSSEMRPEDTAKSERLQGQEEKPPRETSGNGGVNVRARALTPLEKIIAEGAEDETLQWGRQNFNKVDDKELLGHLGDFHAQLNDLLTWKEDLRLLTITHMVPGPYYESWTKEANLFFRRLVIINKRLKSLKKQKRA